MGTRGLIGFRLDGQDKLTYNHFDSYPEGLGKAIVKWCRKIRRRKNGFEGIKQSVQDIQMVSEQGTPTKEQRVKCIELGLYDGNVSTGSEEDFYCLLRNAQGDLDAYLKAGLMTDGSNFIKNSLFCEYGYIINLDDMTLEIYRGFIKTPTGKGRYASKIKPKGWKPSYKGENYYYPCTLAITFPLDNIPLGWLGETNATIKALDAIND